MVEQVVWLVANGGYWKAVWNDPAGAGRKSRSLGAKAGVSRRQAGVLCRQIEADLRKTAHIMGEAPPLSVWLEFYNKSRGDVAPATLSTYRECGIYLRIHFIANPGIDKINRAGASEWMSAMASGALTAELNARAKVEDAWKNPAGRSWRPPKQATVARHVRTAKLIFAAAVDQDRILINPFDRLKGSSPMPHKQWREVTPADLEKILDACPNQGWKSLFSLCRLSGLRLTEALELKWSDFDWKGNRFTVNESVEVDTTKRRRRVVPLEPARAPTGLYRMLEDAFHAAPDGATLVCDGITHNNLRRTALGILRRSGVGAYSKPFHTLRKCRISELAMQYPQQIIEEWCGHDEAVSRRHYQRVPDELYQGFGHDLDTADPKNSPQPIPKPDS